jgi:hypothetical protein
MQPQFTDDDLYRTDGVFYPCGYTFAMFADADRARLAADSLRELVGVGLIQVLSSKALLAQMGERADQMGNLPSVRRELQFMLRFIELARKGMCGLLIEVAHADTDAIAAALKPVHPAVACYYRQSVIEELAHSTPRTTAAREP